MSPVPLPYEKLSTLVARFFFRNLLLRFFPSAAPTTRSVSCSPFGAAALAQRRRSGAPGKPRRGTASCTRTLFRLLLVLFVGIDDARDQRVADHVLRPGLREGDA